MPNKVIRWLERVMQAVEEAGQPRGPWSSYKPRKMHDVSNPKPKRRRRRKRHWWEV